MKKSRFNECDRLGNVKVNNDISNWSLYSSKH